MKYFVCSMGGSGQPLYCLARGTEYHASYWQMTANEWHENAEYCWYIDLDNLLKEFCDTYKEPIGPNWCWVEIAI